MGKSLSGSIPSFSQEQINMLAKSVIENSQVNETWESQKILPQIFSQYQSMIYPELLEKLEALKLIKSNITFL